MHISLFKKLAADFSLSQARYFSQVDWLKLHFSTEQNTICSGLIDYWLIEKLSARSPLLQVEEPSAELLIHLTLLQKLSFYPAFPKDFNPSERELQLLSLKYGSRDWKKIQRIVNDQHQNDFILYDLSRKVHYDSATIVHYANLQLAIKCKESIPAVSAVIGVLRYLVNGRPEGHRIAYYRDLDNSHHFFDPNAGEVIEPRDVNFHQWLKSFILNTNYKKSKPSPHEPFLTLYKLVNISLLK
jgi:hypothetical protein